MFTFWLWKIAYSIYQQITFGRSFDLVVKKQQSANYCASERNAYWGSEITRQNFLQSKCHILHSMKDFQSVKQIVKVPVIDLCVVEYVSAWLEMWSQRRLLSKHCIKFIVSCWYHFKCFCTMFINICWIKLHSWRRIWMIRGIPGFFKLCLSITGMELIIEIYIQVFKGNCCNLSKERLWIQLLFSGRFSWVSFWLIFHFSNKKNHNLLWFKYCQTIILSRRQDSYTSLFETLMRFKARAVH